MRNTRPDIKPSITNVVVAIPIHQTIVRTVIQITANVSNTQAAEYTKSPFINTIDYAIIFCQNLTVYGKSINS